MRSARVALPKADCAAASVLGTSRGARRGKLPRTANPRARGVADHHAFFKKNCRLRSGAPRSFTRSSVLDLVFAFLVLPVEFSSLLVTKKCHILRFISKDPSRGHLRRSRPFLLARSVSSILSRGRATMIFALSEE